MENKRQDVKVKEWFIEKAQRIATSYNCFIDFARDEKDMCKVENGYMTVTVEEVLGETEKAVHVRLRTGDVVGSINGWKLWIPKSLIAA